MLSKLLLGIDASASSLAAAHWTGALAERLVQPERLSILLVHVVPTPDPATATVPGAHGTLPEPADAREIERLSEPSLAAGLHILGGTPATVETRALAGTPSDELLATASAAAVDAIVVGRRGRNPVAEILLGSTSERLLRLSPRPVIVVPESTAPGPTLSRILLATDGSPAALAAARWAGALADSVGGLEMTVLHVVHLGGDDMDVGPDGRPILRMVPLDAAVANSARPIFDTTLEALGPARRFARTQTAIGAPAAEIVAAVRAGGYDLVVLGHRGLGRISELLLGSVGERVVRLARCPVAVVHG